MMNKIKELQKKLDKKKYLFSEKVGKDLSGQFSTCFGCEFRDVYNQGCFAESTQRTEQCLCAKAYNEYLGGKYETRR